MKISRIYLTGFMTSGKSTIGPILANVLVWDFYDLDKVIEKEEKKTVVEIFEEKGEDYFREVETKFLREFSELDHIIISLGGGTITNKVNVDLMKSSGKIIYLKTSPEMIYKRLRFKIDRPLFRNFVLSENSKEEFVAKIEELLQKRSPFYEKADLTINTDNTPVGITVDKLAKLINGMLHADN